MIAKLSGIFDSAAGDSLIIDVGGVGYLVHASRRTLANLGQPGDPVSLLIETHMREDGISLYGFSDAAEREWFRLLYSVQGVGPKAALAILSVCPPDRLAMAIASGDAHAVRQAEGIGPKLATRIVTELKDKAGKIDLSPQKAGVKMAAVAANAGEPARGDAAPDVAHDAVSALVNLGYARTDAYQAVMQARGKANDNESLQELIRLALKELAS